MQRSYRLSHSILNLQNPILQSSLVLHSSIFIWQSDSCLLILGFVWISPSLKKKISMILLISYCRGHDNQERKHCEWSLKGYRNLKHFSQHSIRTRVPSKYSAVPPKYSKYPTKHSAADFVEIYIENFQISWANIVFIFSSFKYDVAIVKDRITKIYPFRFA